MVESRQGWLQMRCVSRCARAKSPVMLALLVTIAPPAKGYVSGRIRPNTDLYDTCQDPSREPQLAAPPPHSQRQVCEGSLRVGKRPRKTKVAPRYGLRITPSL